MAGRKRRDPMQVTLACSKCTCQGQNPDLLMSRPRGLHHPQAAPFQVRLIPMSNDLQTKLYGACWKAGQPSCNTSIPLWTGSLSAHSSPSCCLSESIFCLCTVIVSLLLSFCVFPFVKELIFHMGISVNHTCAQPSRNAQHCAESSRGHTLFHPHDHPVRWGPLLALFYSGGDAR